MKIFGLIFTVAFAWHASCFSAKEEVKACLSSREFITTFEFLKSNSDFELSGDLSFKYASEVAKGCTGAAKRFIETASNLRKSDLSLRDILDSAKSVALKDDASSAAFNYIFKRAFAEDGFDLDLESSLKLAKSLSVEFEGETKIALSDFEQVAEFCYKRKGLDLPLAKCAELAQRVALAGEDFQVSAAEPFLSSYRYLISKNGPSLAINEALVVAENLIKTHPQAVENFKLAFDYGTRKQGLKLSKDEAIKFAKKMASATVFEAGSTPEEQKPANKAPLKSEN